MQREAGALRADRRRLMRHVSTSGCARPSVKRGGSLRQTRLLLQSVSRRAVPRPRKQGWLTLGDDQQLVAALGMARPTCSVHLTLRPGWLGWPWNGSRISMNASTMPAARVMPPGNSFRNLHFIGVTLDERSLQPEVAFLFAARRTRRIVLARQGPACLSARFPDHGPESDFRHRRVIGNVLDEGTVHSRATFRNRAQRTASVVVALHRYTPARSRQPLDDRFGRQGIRQGLDVHVLQTLRRQGRFQR